MIITEDILNDKINKYNSHIEVLKKYDILGEYFDLNNDRMEVLTEITSVLKKLLDIKKPPKKEPPVAVLGTRG